MEEVKCNLCGSRSSKLWFKKEGALVKRKFNLVRCNKCGLVYVNPRLDLEESSKLYDQEYYEGKGFDPREEGKAYTDILEKEGSEEKKDGESNSVINLIKFLKPFENGQKLLDVGCGVGNFLRNAIEKGYDCYGVDFSDDAAKMARKTGADVFCGEIGEVKGEYDIITMMEVIEHHPNPKKFIADAYLRLKKGGMLVILTANVDAIVPKVKKEKWEYCIPEGHIYYFSPKTLKRYLGDFSKKEVYLFPKEVSRSLSNLKFFKKEGDGKSLLFRFYLPISPKLNLIGTQMIGVAFK